MALTSSVVALAAAAVVSAAFQTDLSTPAYVTSGTVVDLAQSPII